MIRSDQRGAATVQLGVNQLQRFVVVDVIQMQEGKDPGIGGGASQSRANVGAAEMFIEQARGQSARPFVEVAHQHTRAYVVAVLEHVVVEQFARLAAALGEGSSQVDVVDME